MAAEYPISFSKGFGAKCHQRSQGDVPICVVTDLDNNFLFSNAPNWRQENSSKNPWLITSAKVSLTRFFSASTAFINLACKLESIFQVPDFLPEIRLQGKSFTPPETEAKSEEAASGQQKPQQSESTDSKPSDQNSPQKPEAVKIVGGIFTNGRMVEPEDEIMIYMGYIPSIRPVSMDDIEDDRLLRVFVGSIDTISATGTQQGIIATIQCRDRIKYLMDTQVRLSTKEEFKFSFRPREALGTDKFQGVSNVPTTPTVDVSSTTTTPTEINSFPYHVQQGRTDGKCQTAALIQQLRASGVHEIQDATGKKWPMTIENVNRIYSKQSLQSTEGYKSALDEQLRKNGKPASVRLYASTKQEAIQNIKKALDRGQVVNLQGDMTESGHFVTITGYNDKGFIVQDPYGQWNGSVAKPTSQSYTYGNGKDQVYSFDTLGNAMMARGPLLAVASDADKKLVSQRIVGPQMSNSTSRPTSGTTTNFSQYGYNPDVGKKYVGAARSYNAPPGYCFQGVADILQRANGGRDIFVESGLPVAHAYQAAAILERMPKQFREIPVPRSRAEVNKMLDNLPPGAIVVWQSGQSATGHPSGHISITTRPGEEVSSSIIPQMKMSAPHQVTPPRVFLPIASVGASSVKPAPSTSKSRSDSPTSSIANTASSTVNLARASTVNTTPTKGNNIKVHNTPATERAQAVAWAAKRLGVTVEDVETIVQIESRNRNIIRGGDGGHYQGYYQIRDDFISNGRSEGLLTKYGIPDRGNNIYDYTFLEQTKLFVAHAEQKFRGYKPGMGVRALYNAHNLGNVWAKGSDAYGTPGGRTNKLDSNSSERAAARSVISNYQDLLQSLNVDKELVGVSGDTSAPGNTTTTTTTTTTSDNSPASSGPLGLEDIARSAFILVTARMGVGHVDNAEASCELGGILIQAPDPSKGEVYDLQYGTSAEPDRFYINFLRSSTTNKDFKVEYDPKFLIQVGRVGLLKGSDTQQLVARSLTLINQAPIDVIKFFATQEPYPTEVFMDNRTGNYYYAPRACDISALAEQDRNRFCRTYYFRNIPSDVNEVDANQMLISFKEEFTSLGTKTNFIVTKEDTSSANANLSGGMVALHAAMRPNFLIGKRIAAKVSYVVDNTIMNYGEAGAVALAMARITAKEGRVGMAVMLGDPSLIPGEMVQVIGSPLYPKGLVPGVAQRERREAVEYNERFRKIYKGLLDMVMEGKGVSDPNNASFEKEVVMGTREADDVRDDQEPELIEKFTVRPVTMAHVDNNLKLMCAPHNPSGGENHGSMVSGVEHPRLSGFKDEPRTIFRIEGVIHEFNTTSRGYETHVALMSPF